MNTRNVFTSYPTTICIQECHVEAIRNGTLEFEYVLDRETRKVICKANMGLIKNSIREFSKNGHKFYVANYKPNPRKR